MTYRIELAATAKADIRLQAQWLRENVSLVAATKWLDGLYKAIDALRTRPQRCPLAAESDRFPEELHELLHGKRGNRKHRPTASRAESLFGIGHPASIDYVQPLLIANLRHDPSAISNVISAHLGSVRFANRWAHAGGGSFRFGIITPL